MTRDASAQAVHERLEHVVATMPEPDVEAGWAALVAQLEPPVAPVVPLHRPRPYKAIVLGVAAAILIGGSASGDGRPRRVPTASRNTGQGRIHRRNRRSAHPSGLLRRAALAGTDAA